MVVVVVVVPCRVCGWVSVACFGSRLSYVRNLRIWAQNLDEAGFREGRG